MRHPRRLLALGDDAADEDHFGAGLGDGEDALSEEEPEGVDLALRVLAIAQDDANGAAPADRDHGRALDDGGCDDAPTVSPSALGSALASALGDRLRERDCAPEIVPPDG